MEQTTIDSLQTLVPAISSLCKNFSFRELKSLSLASSGWFEATADFVIDRGIITIKAPCKSSLIRNYKHVSIVEVDSIDVFPALPVSIEELVLVRNEIENIRQLQKFKKLKSLCLLKCEFADATFTPSDLVVGLQNFESHITIAQDINLIRELIKANVTLERLSLVCDEPLAGIDDLIAKIRLSNLQDFAIEGTDNTKGLNLKTALIECFQNHNKLKTCSLRDVNIDDQVIRALRMGCDTLERLSLICCALSESKRATVSQLFMMNSVKHLDLSLTNFAAEDLNKFNPKLKSLEVQTPFLSILRSVLQPLKNIRVLKLFHMEEMMFMFSSSNPTIFEFLAEQMPHLIDLSLQILMFEDCRNIRKVFKFERLEKLEVRSLNVGSEMLCLINAPKLRVLNVFDYTVGKKELIHTFATSPLIEDLRFNRVGDLVFEYIVKQKSSSLKRLDCPANIQGLKLLLKKARIEKSVVVMTMKELNKVGASDGIPAFRNFLYSEHVKIPRTPTNRKLANGLSTIYLVHNTELFTHE